MAAAIQSRTGVKPEMIKSKGGAFEVRRDGKLVFSKLKEGRFPEPEEILSKLA